MEALSLYVYGCLAADDGKTQLASELFGKAQAIFMQERRESWAVRCMIQQAGILFDCGFFEAAEAILSFPDEAFHLDEMTSLSLMFEREMIHDAVMSRRAVRN